MDNARFNSWKLPVVLFIFAISASLSFAQISGSGGSGSGNADQKIEDPNAPAPVQVTPFTDSLRGTMDCSNPVASIPDNDPGGLSDTIVIAGPGVVDDLDVSLDVTHSWVGDLIVTLEKDGTTVTLMDQPGVPASTFGCSGNNISVVFDDAGGSTVENECGATDPVLNGTFAPEGALSDFIGTDWAGTWTLTISDNAGGDTGTLDEWCLIPVLSGLCDLTDLSIDTDTSTAHVTGVCDDFNLWRRVDGVDTNLGTFSVDGEIWINIEIVSGAFYFVSAPGDPTPVIIVGPIVVVPTLGEWGLIAFITLLMAASLFYMKKNRTRLN